MREPSGEGNCVTGPQGKFNARNVGRFSCADAKATIKGIRIAKQAPAGRRIWPASREFGCRGTLASILVDRLHFAERFSFWSARNGKGSTVYGQMFSEDVPFVYLFRAKRTVIAAHRNAKSRGWPDWR